MPCFNFSSPVPKITANVEILGVELDRLVVLAKPTERTAQAAQRLTFPIPVPKLTGNVEILAVELDRLVVLAKSTERTAQAA